MNQPGLAAALAAYRERLEPPTARRRWRAPAAAALAAVVLAGGAAAVLGPGADPRPAVEEAPPSAPPDPPAGDVGGSGAGATVGPSAALAAAAELTVPPPAVWRPWSSTVLRTWLPAVPGAGPADPERLAGFARTPAGALAAAATLHPVVFYERDRAAWDALADGRVVWAAGQREQLAAELAQVWQAGADDPAEAVPLGYRLIAYAPDAARFRLWWRVSFPGAVQPVVGALVDVVWSGGDWRLLFDEAAMDLRPLQGADTYLAWGPR